MRAAAAATTGAGLPAGCVPAWRCTAPPASLAQGQPSSACSWCEPVLADTRDMQRLDALPGTISHLAALADGCQGCCRRRRHRCAPSLPAHEIHIKPHQCTPR